MLLLLLNHVLYRRPITLKMSGNALWPCGDTTANHEVRRKKTAAVVVIIIIIIVIIIIME